MCITDEILRAKLDGELGGTELRETEQHLTECEDCRRRETVMAARMKSVGDVLASLGPDAGQAAIDPHLAYADFRASHAVRDTAPSLGNRFWTPRWAALAAAAAVAAAVVLVSFAPARSWAQKVLAMLRVQRVEVVEVNPVALPADNGSRTGNVLAQFISDKLVVTESPGKPQAAADADQATQLAGFHVRLLSDRPDQPQIAVEGEQGFHMTVDRERLQAILDEAGRSDVRLPASLDGATIAVHIPKMMFARYGNCPQPRRGDELESTPDAAPPSPSAASTGSEAPCVVLAEVPSPTVSVPPDLDIEQLAEAGLQFGGMSADEARAFCQTVDWKSTLVVPIPRDGASTQKVDVDGTEGTLVTMPRRGRRALAGYSLVWVKSGIIYLISGDGSPANAVPLAESLD